eukprot:3767955-Amphidinium_carterae.1
MEEFYSATSGDGQTPLANREDDEHVQRERFLTKFLQQWESEKVVTCSTGEVTSSWQEGTA